ncbi:MAG TPA: plastocyanin/azurin family copper-binding protein [Actinomycetota bacterium]|nr:plastocyanin/azurin family copper-binding protein [Actinomycetota bacterium]
MQESSPAKSRRRVAIAGLCATGLIAVAGASQGATHTVRATGNRTWKPASLSVASGSKVVWRNPTDDKHNVVSYKGPWSKKSTLAEGGRTSFTFRKAGTYKYRCTLHSAVSDGKCNGMCGQVRVS